MYEWRSMKNSVFRHNLDTIPTENLPYLLIFNENQVSFERNPRVNKEYIFRFGTKPGICMLLWHKIQRQMTPNVMLFFN